MTIYAIIVALALIEALAIFLAAFPPRFRLNRRLPESPECYSCNFAFGPGEGKTPSEEQERRTTGTGEHHVIVNRRDGELVLIVKFSRRQIAETLGFLGKTLSAPCEPGPHSPPQSPDSPDAQSEARTRDDVSESCKPFVINYGHTALVLQADGNINLLTLPPPIDCNVVT